MFIDSRCNQCGDCLVQCPYLGFDPEEGVREFSKLLQGERVGWLKRCITCFACNEICPTGARPFDLIVRRMEEAGDYVPPQLLAGIRARFAPQGAFIPPAVRNPVLALCTIDAAAPWAFQGPLFEGLDVVKGRHFFCNVLFPHLGNGSIMEEGLRGLVDRYAALGVEEVIFAHDDCYALMADVAPQLGVDLPFKATHLFEYLLRYLEAHRNQVRPLGMTVAYQRPCASRLTPAKEGMLDDLFGRIGVRRAPRRYDGLHALCCGQSLKGFMPRGDRYPAYQELNIGDAKDHGAEAMAFLCPMCLDALGKPCREAGLETYMVSDLCRMALGEAPPAGPSRKA